MARVRHGLLQVSATAIAVGAAMLAASEAAASPRPQVGQPCSGAEIGRKVTDDKGRTIMCNNYRWQIYHGQAPKRPWVDNQRR